MGSTVRGVVRTMLAGSLIAALVGCATSGPKVSCDGKLTPINPSSATVAGTQGAADQRSHGAAP